jgi:hypothetical protein
MTPGCDTEGRSGARTRAVRVALLLGLLPGCTTTPQPPAGAEPVPVAVPPVGMRFTERLETANGRVVTRTYTVLGDEDFRGRPVRRVAADARVMLLDLATASWVADLVNGQVQAYAAPHEGTFAPPPRRASPP